MSKTVFPLAAAALFLGLSGCSDPEAYDASTPQAALDAMHAMIADQRPQLISGLIYIQPREITFGDGVTEASAIGDVLDKTGDMLAQLFRVAGKLRQRFPGDVERELARVDKPGGDAGLFGPDLGRFLTDPFGLLDDQRQRLTVEDLGDGTAAILLDGKPALGGLGLMMREVDGQWKVQVPIHLLKEWRPNTRHEWSVLASMMISLENSLGEFEQELDAGDFRNWEQAGHRAGRLVGESVVIQALLYESMKRNAETAPEPAAAGNASS